MILLMPHVSSSQAFCRVAAVAGALYVLRRPVSALLLDPEPLNPGPLNPGNPGTTAARGVRLASGQELRCGALAGDVEACVGLKQQHLRRQQGGSSGGGGSGSGGGGSGGGAAASSVASPAAGSGAAESVADAAAGAGVSNGGISSAVARAIAVTDSPLQQVHNCCGRLLLCNRLKCSNFSASEGRRHAPCRPSNTHSLLRMCSTCVDCT